MIKIIKDLKSSKTFWLAVTTMLGAAEEWSRGQVSTHQAVMVLALSLGGICIRHAIHKLDPKAELAATKVILIGASSTSGTDDTSVPKASG